MGQIPSIEQAKELLHKYTKQPFLLRHGEIVSGVMAHFAEAYDPERVEYWRVVGLLHDLDYEQFPEEHCVKCQELMQAEGIDEGLIHSVASHGWGMTKVDDSFKPELMMERILFACDELTGLIGAVTAMRPSKSVSDLELKSVKKKYKDLKFAAGCSRETIEKGAEMLGWTLDELIERTILAMRSLIDSMEI